VPVFISHAGCPHRCVFCNQNIVTNQRSKTPDSSLIDLVLGTYLPPAARRAATVEISFYGGNFLGLPPETVSQMLIAAQTYVTAGQVDSLRFSTRPDTINNQTLALIAPFAVETVEIGVQSMDDSVLNRTRRGHNAEASRRAVARLKRAGYQVGVQLMVGLPAECDESLARTLAATVEMAPDFVRIYPTLVLPDSVLARWCQVGHYSPMSLTQAVRCAKKMFRAFYRQAIPVVRMGLQPTDCLSAAVARGAVTGPYHPAFGHLVHEALFLDAAVMLLRDPDRPRAPAIRVHPRRVSAMRGCGNTNITRLQTWFDLEGLSVIADENLDAAVLSIGDQTINAFAARN
jgi:histone acetyltransferase (RNA polymerase elongator complex component)